MASGGDLVMLMDNTQLKKLALLLRNKEEALMTQVAKSQVERVKYIKSVNDSYNQCMSLLDDSTEMRDKYAAAGGDFAVIAHDALEYVRTGINFGLQNIRNCWLRVDCISKIRTHYDSVASELATLEHDDLPNAKRLAEEMAGFKNAMKEYCIKNRSASSRALSKAYSMLIKQEGKSLPEIINRTMKKLGYEGEFEHLTDAQKLDVNQTIITESGRSNMSKLEMLSSAAGVAVLAAAASLIVWDIFTAEHKAEAVVRDTVSVFEAVGAFAVQVTVEAAVTEMVAEVELGVFIVSLAGFVTGMAAGVLFAAVGGALVDIILGSGGSKAPPVTDLKFHTGTMPDGMALARIIAHDG